MSQARYAQVPSGHIAATLETLFHLQREESRTSGEWFTGECSDELLDSLSATASEHGIELIWQSVPLPALGPLRCGTTDRVRQKIDRALADHKAEQERREAARRDEEKRLNELPRPIISYMRRPKKSA